MTTTPGVIARRKDGAWVQDGSYVLTVPNASALPNAPANDDVFAFVHDTQKLMRSRTGAWVEFTSGSASTAGYFAAPLGPLTMAVSTNYELPIGAVTLSSGFTKSGTTRVQCDRAGVYHVAAAVTATGAAAQWVIVTVQQLRGATLVSSFGHVGGYTSNGFGLSTAVGEFSLQVGDLLSVQVSSSGATTIDARSTLAVSAVGGPKGDRGDPGAGATTMLLDDLIDVTAPTPAASQLLRYNGTSKQWENFTGFVDVHHGSAYVDLGSSTAGGIVDVVTTGIPWPFAFQVDVRVEATLTWGFGQNATAAGADLLNIGTGGVLDDVGQMYSPGSYWTRTMLHAFYPVPAGQNPNSKLRRSGVNFNGTNCYFRGRVVWQVTRMG
jgi:hypothetical protein